MTSPAPVNPDAVRTAPLASEAVRELRARAHALKPVVWIASAGATAGSLNEVDRALHAHELVKIHAAVDGGRTAREDLLASICDQLGARPVQIIGKMLIVFRQRPAPSGADNPSAARQGRPERVRQEPAKRKKAPQRRPAAPRKKNSAKRPARTRRSRD